ncbi:MAG: broad specificity phosphatase PhoE [Paraglaciecola sp.]|jgi:broad specificity phosphatase PhoE
MNIQYEQLVNDPELNITPVIESYTEAARTYKAIKDTITNKYNHWQEIIVVSHNITYGDTKH